MDNQLAKTFREKNKKKGGLLQPLFVRLKFQKQSVLNPVASKTPALLCEINERIINNPYSLWIEGSPQFTDESFKFVIGGPALHSFVIQPLYPDSALKSFLKIGSIHAVDANNFPRRGSVDKFIIADVNSHVSQGPACTEKNEISFHQFFTVYAHADFGLRAGVTR